MSDHSERTSAYRPRAGDRSIFTRSQVGLPNSYVPLSCTPGTTSARGKLKLQTFLRELAAGNEGEALGWAQPESKHFRAC